MGLSFQDETLMSEATETLHFRVEHDQSTSETGYISQETRNDSDDIGFSSSNVDIQIVEERWYLREAAWFVIDEITLFYLRVRLCLLVFFFSFPPCPLNFSCPLWVPWCQDEDEVMKRKVSNFMFLYYRWNQQRYTQFQLHLHPIFRVSFRRHSGAIDIA